MHYFRHPTAALAVLSALLAGTPCLASETDRQQEIEIQLSDESIAVNGTAINTGTNNDDPEENGVFLSNDIVYYEDRDTYDSGNVYGEGTEEDKHTVQEAQAHTVISITAPGTYRVSGTLSQGQIAVDLGEDARTDPDAVVTLILDNADITCTVAPAIMVYNVYECDTAWTAYNREEAEDYSASATQDTSDAGFNLILADDSVNHLSGSYVARIYKDNEEQKKKHKYDGAVCTNMSMNLDGEKEGTGILNIEAEKEGLESNLHLTINGGTVNIQSQDDGLNSNEDGVSVTTINGGSLHIVAGLGEEGDGVDSNGYLVINGGTVIAAANPASDSGLDSDMGSYVNGGYVVATGSTMDWAESDSDQVTMNLQFAASQDADEAIIVTDTEGTVLFAYDPDKDETTGSNNRGYQGAIISCPAFAVGDTCHVYVGGDVEGEETNGLYDVSTVTGFEGAILQEYTGTDVGRGGFGRPMMGRPESGERQEPPKGFQPGENAETSEENGLERMPENMGEFNPSDDADMRKFPDNTDTGNPPGNSDTDNIGNGAGKPDAQSNDGLEPPEKPNDSDSPQNPSGQPFTDDSDLASPSEPSSEFHMTDKVNAFSGVTDSSTDVLKQ